jgi:hypothetical protein
MIRTMTAPGREERTKDRIEEKESESKNCFAEQTASFIKHISRDVARAVQHTKDFDPVSGGAKEDHILLYDDAPNPDAEIVSPSAHSRMERSEPAIGRDLVEQPNPGIRVVN